jgi:hypothetical protein
MDWDAYAGYVLLALVVFRLLWDFLAARPRGSHVSSPHREKPPAISRSCSDENPTVRLATIRPGAGW